MKLSRRIAMSFTAIILSFSPSVFASSGLTPIYNDKGSMIARIDGIAGNGWYGEQEGEASAASFRQPTGLAVGANNDLYITDSLNHKIMRLNSGTIRTYAGPASSLLRDANGQPLGTLLNGSKGAALFNTPTGIAYGADGNLYVADSNNNAIRKITPSGEISTLAGNGTIGSTDGQGAASRFYHPEGIAVTKSGIVYIADTLNHVIRKITPDGNTVTLTAASDRVIEYHPGHVLLSGDYGDGEISRALFNEPTDLTLDSKNNLYVSDSGNQRIRYIDFAANKVTTVAGGINNERLPLYAEDELYAAGGYKDGKAQTAKFNFPKGITLDTAGGLLIADSQNNVIRYLKDDTVTTLAGSPGISGLQDGYESTALLNSPQDVAIASDGTIYVADMGNNRIRKITPYRLPADISKNPTALTVALEDKQIIFDASPEIKNGRVMVPVRQIAEGLGFKLTYSPGGQIVRLEKEANSIELHLGSKTITLTNLSGKEQSNTMDIAPYAKLGRTYVPLRFFAEEAGVDVQWSSALQTAILRYKYNGSALEMHD